MSYPDRNGMTTTERIITVLCAGWGFACWWPLREPLSLRWWETGMGVLGGAVCLGWLAWDVWPRRRRP